MKGNKHGQWKSDGTRALIMHTVISGITLLLCLTMLGTAFAVDPASPPDKFQVTVEDPDNPGNNITVNLYKRSVRRANNYKIWNWDSTNGYVEETAVPPVRTYRGFVAEHPNIIVCGVLFSNGEIRMSAHDSEWGRGYRWKIKYDFTNQLPTAPVGTGLANPSTVLPPDNPVVRPPTIGRAVQPVGGIQVAELAFDIQYNYAGGDLDRAVAEHEHEANIYDLAMVRDCQISIQVSQAIFRKENFHNGSVSLGRMYDEFMKEPMRSTGWDILNGSYGWYAWQNSIGQDEGGVSGGLGALLHEGGHTWDAQHSIYHYDAMEGNRPHHGPFNVDRVLEKRLESMVEGDLAQLSGNYSDPVHPYAYVDVARVDMDSPTDIDVLANDWDSNGDSISVINVVANFGTATINPDGTIHYIPSAGFLGKDILVYTIQDDSAYQLKTRDLVHIEVVNNDLMVHYDFDETAGTIVDNKTGNANLDGEIVIGDFAQNSVPSPVLPNNRGVRSINNTADNGRYHRANRGAITVGKEGKIIPTGLGYDRSIVPGSPWDTGTGQDNNAYNASPFDYERGEHGNHCDPMDGDYTLAFWFMHDADNLVGNYDVVRLATKFYNREYALGFSLWASEDGKLSAQIMPFYQYGAQYDRGRNWITLQSNADAVQPRRWHHAALVIDRNGGDDVRLYLDGQLVSENTTQLLAGQQIFMGRKPIRLGDTNGDNTCFDDLRVYTKALTATDVAGLWQMQPDHPTFESPLDLTVDLIQEENLYSYSLGNHINYGSDGPGAFSKVSGPDWVNVTTDGTLFGYPATTDAGQSVAGIRVTDGNGDFTDLTVNLDVRFNFGLHAHWTFDEGSGTSVGDSGPNGYNGTIFGDPIWTTGVDGGALSFDYNDYVDIGQADITGDWSATMWIKRQESIRSSASLLNGGTSALKLEQWNNTDQVGFTKFGVGDYKFGYTVPTGSWTHLAYVGTASGTKLYVDGVYHGVIGETIDCPLDTIGTNNAYSLVGDLDDLRIYNRSLGDGEVAGLAVISNTPPVATDDTSLIGEGNSWAIPVLVNDSDPEGKPLGVMSVTQGANGTVVNNLGNVIYTPNPGFTGNDTFTYIVNDGSGGQDTATVNVTVLDQSGPGLFYGEVPGNINVTDPNPRAAVTVDLSETENGIGGNTTEIYTGEIYDADGNISFTEDIDDKVRIYIDGQLVLSDDMWNNRGVTGNLALTPGWHQIEIRISNGGGGSGPVTSPGIGYDPDGGTNWVHLEDPGDGSVLRYVTGVPSGNNPPVFTVDLINKPDADEDAAYNDTIADSATDEDSDPLTYSKASGPAWLSVASDGTLSGTPTNGDVGVNAFTVQVSDGNGGTATATVNITVNAASPYSAGLLYGELAGAMNLDPNPASSVTTDLSETEDSIADYTTEVYTGEIYDADGNISFTENIDDKFRLFIDGNLVLSSDYWNDRTSTGNLMLTPGWHTIEIRLGNVAGGSGPRNAPGFGFDPAGGTNWIHPEDPGDGSLFRHVSVASSNNAPVANDASFAVAENAATGASVGTVSATDPDAGDTLSYAITAGNGGGEFAINSSTGEITTAAVLDYEATAQYVLTVTVTDNGTPVLSDTATITVNVSDVVETTAPVVATGAASNITQTGADIGFTVTDDGGEAPTVTLYYGQTDGGAVAGNWDSSSALGTQSTGSYSASVSGLTEGTTYYFTIHASNSAGEAWGSSGSFTTEADSSPKLVRTTVNNVSSTSWTGVDLGQTYNSSVIIATPIYPNSTIAPVVTRIRNVSGSGFEVKIDRADGQTGAVTCDVSIVAVEEGVYTQAADGVTMEAVKYTSTVTAENNNWTAEARTYQNSYTAPVVVGQVMSANDANWSTFWCQGSSRTSPPSASSLSVGKHVGEDPTTARANETIGYIVIESGNGTINDIAYSAGVGSDIVRGTGNTSSGYNYSLSGLTSASAAAVSLAGMDGSDGGWAVLYGASPLTSTQLRLAVDEDQLANSERKHTTEQCGYIVFE